METDEFVLEFRDSSDEEEEVRLDILFELFQYIIPMFLSTVC